MTIGSLLKRLTPAQQRQMATYSTLLQQFNRRHNLISRETTAAEVEDRHLLHCLTLTLHPFPEGSQVVDWGTGGGLPAIPLAIACPHVTVHAVDAVGKKIQAVRAMTRRLGLDNLEAWHGRAEKWPGPAHYSVSRATAPLLDLWSWHQRVVVPIPADAAAWPPGLHCLKGGDLTDEIAALQQAFPQTHIKIVRLDELSARPFFTDKYIVSVVEREI